MEKPDKGALEAGIMGLVDEMARAAKTDNYSWEREGFGLLLRIRTISPGWFLTAKAAWEYAGLTREDLVRRFQEVRGSMEVQQ